MRLPILQLSCWFFFSGKASHHPGLSAPLQPRFGFLRLLAFPKVKFSIGSEEICECNSHTVHIIIHCRSVHGHYLPFVYLPSTFLPYAVPSCKNQLQEDRQCMCNITLRHVYVTIDAAEKPWVLHIYSKCAYVALSYPARKVVCPIM